MKNVMGFTSLIRDDLARVADALEHIAFPLIKHEGKSCRICLQKNRPVRKMKQSVVMTEARLRKREAEVRIQKMLHGPEEPVADMFRYRELNRENT